MKRTLAIIGLILVAVLMIAGSVALASTIGSTTPVTHTATGVAAQPPPTQTPSYSFQLFEQDGVTPLAQPIAWGNVTVGTPATHSIVIKNTGNQAYGMAVDTSQVPAGWTLTASNVTGLAPGATATMTLTLSTTAVGAVSFTTPFNSIY